MTESEVDCLRAANARLNAACAALVKASEVELDAERSDGTTEVYGRFISPEAWEAFVAAAGVSSP